MFKIWELSVSGFKTCQDFNTPINPAFWASSSLPRCCLATQMEGSTGNICYNRIWMNFYLMTYDILLGSGFGICRLIPTKVCVLYDFYGLCACWVLSLRSMLILNWLVKADFCHYRGLFFSFVRVHSWLWDFLQQLKLHFTSIKLWDL